MNLRKELVGTVGQVARIGLECERGYRNAATSEIDTLVGIGACVEVLAVHIRVRICPKDFERCVGGARGSKCALITRDSVSDCCRASIDISR